MTGSSAARLCGALLAVALAGCGSTPSPAATPTAPPSPTAATGTPASAGGTASPTSDACVVAVQAPPPASFPADFATALAFAPDGRLFYTERSGRVRVWQAGASRTFATVATVTAEADGSYSERGLLGLAISPSFATDRFVYAFYSDRDRVHQRVIRWRDCAGTGTQASVVVTLPSGSDCCHKGGRIAFGGDGMLYVTLGDEHAAGAAQNTADVRGKVLRYRPDGTIPADNPFGPADPVFAYGLRNPFGIAVAPGGQVAVTNNGPSGDAGSPGTGYDTVILALVRGGAYQWPLCYGYSHPLAGRPGCDGRRAPDWSSESATVVPTGSAWVDGAAARPYAGHLVVCSYEGGMLIVTPSTPHAAVAHGPSQCRLAVTEGPDHGVYVSDGGNIDRLS